MDVKLLSYFGALEQAEGSLEVWDLFLQFIGTCAFKVIVYGYDIKPTRGFGDTHEGAHGMPEAVQDRMTMMSNMDPALSDAYVSEGLFEYDLVAEHTLTSFNPILVGVDFVPKDGNPNYAKQVELFERTASFGAPWGIAVPITNASRRGSGAVVIYCDETKQRFLDILEKDGARLQAACLYFHQYFQIHHRKEKAREIGITTRQFEVMEFIVSGLQNREIAERMGVKEATVSLHITELKKKLKVATAREIIRAAIGLGLVDL